MGKRFKPKEANRHYFELPSYDEARRREIAPMIKPYCQGVIKTNDGELNRLQNSLNCLTSKINNANFQSLVTEVNTAYHAYSPKH